MASGIGYLLYQEAEQRSEARAAREVLGEATAQLKGGLKSVPPGAVERIEEGLRAARRWSDAELAEATEQYLVGAREILRRRADAERLTRDAAASRKALAAHMARAGRRDTPWIRSASRLKKQVERHHFDLDMQLGALAELLDSLPEANKRLAPHVEASLLLDDEARAAAHAAVLEEAKRARAALERSRSLLPR